MKTPFSAHTKKLIFNAGMKAIFESGKAVCLITTDQLIHSITIQSHPQNTGIVYVGNADVNVANGVQLLSGEAITLDAHENFIGPVFVTSNSSGSQVQFFSLGE